ncbi:MAG: C40 family peptidase [Pseudonocardiaceae bacterium]
MWSPRHPTTRPRLALLAALLAVALATPPAAADPAPPEDASEAVSRLSDLSHQAEQLTERYHNARADLDARRAAFDAARAAATNASAQADRFRAEQSQFRGRVDNLVAASLQGARTNSVVAILTSESPDDMLDRMTALDLIARDNNEAMRGLTAAVDATTAAETAARDAETQAAVAELAAARIAGDLQRRQRDMQAQIAVVRGELARLSPTDRAAYGGDGETAFQLTPVGSGVAVEATRLALTQQGKPYEWAAEGPDRYDCSGLLYWAYRRLGLSIPRPSRDQARIGTEVSQQEIRPGDLIAFYRPVSHIGIYVGAGKLVHAPQGGDVVKVARVNWSDVTAIRRIG